VRNALKAELKKRGLSENVRANKSGCLDGCEFGVTMVIYPDGIWYGRVQKEDVPEIVDRTIINGEVIQRLLIGEKRFAPDALQYFKLDLPPGIL
jgi:(2Fe-2S) ferredoxin